MTLREDVEVWLVAIRPRCARRLAAGVVALTLCAPGLSRAQGEAGAMPETLTVAQCVALARLQAPALTAAALDERAAASDSTATGFNRRPEFFLSTGAWLAPEWSYDPAFTNLGEYHAQLGMNWTLADGGRRQRARERARLDLEGARARRMQASRDAGENVAALALQSLRLREVGEIFGETRERLDAIGLLVRAGVRSGTRSPADSIRLGFTEEDVALDLETTSAAAVATDLELLDAMGRGLDHPIVVRTADPSDVRAPTPEDSLALLAGAAARPEVALARVEETQARLEALEVGKRNAPAVDLSLDAGLAGTDLTRAVPPSLADETSAHRRR
jgi:outer membrane protein TolC